MIYRALLNDFAPYKLAMRFFVSSVAQLEAEISEYFMRVVYIWTLVISCTNGDISAKTPTRIATRISTTIKIDMNGGYQGS